MDLVSQPIKTLHFLQVRIKVVEARQLPGANISPIARVTCFNQTKQSRVQKSINSPYFNEVFYFNFFQSPADLFDEVVTFGVSGMNSRIFFISTFKCKGAGADLENFEPAGTNVHV